MYLKKIFVIGIYFPCKIIIIVIIFIIIYCFEFSISKTKNNKK